MKQDGPKLGIGLLIPKADTLRQSVGDAQEETKEPTHPAFLVPSADSENLKVPYVTTFDQQTSSSACLYQPSRSDSKENLDTANLGEGTCTQLPLTQGEEEEKGYEQLVNLSQTKTGRVSKDEFSMLKVIGTGSYGKVLLVKKKDSGKLYAMKVLKKKFIKESKQVKGTWAERKILEKITHPFVVKLRFAFQTPKKLFLVLDYCPGGELFFYIQQIGRFKEESAKFYAANILLALECLHENGIVYRE